MAVKRKRDDEVARLINDLADRDFRVRQEATDRLIRLAKESPRAYEAVVETLASTDPEVAGRAAVIQQTVLQNDFDRYREQDARLFGEAQDHDQRADDLEKEAEQYEREAENWGKAGEAGEAKAASRRAAQARRAAAQERRSAGEARRDSDQAERDAAEAQEDAAKGLNGERRATREERFDEREARSRNRLAKEDALYR